MRTWLKRVTTATISAMLLFSSAVSVVAEPEVDVGSETQVV